MTIKEPFEQGAKRFRVSTTGSDAFASRARGLS